MRSSDGRDSPGTHRPRGRRRRHAGLRPERLEDRLALCATHAFDTLVDPATLPDWTGRAPSLEGITVVDHADSFAVSLAASTGTLATRGGTAAAATAVNGLPILHGLPGAPTAIYLDFDGEGANGAYDVDGDPTTFNAAEQATITEAWRQVAVYFSVFDVDVTTVKPTVPFAWHVSSPDISGGYSYVGVFPNGAPQSFNNAADARTRVSGIAHELGHNFGLNHQSDYDLLGTKTKEYSSGYDPLHGPIMGVDYAQSVHKWFIGHPSNSASSLQDDIAVIAGKIRKYQAAGGDGFRADDHGGTFATAQVLAATSGSRSATGIIERLADVDAFSFTTTGDRAVISAVPVKPSGADIRLEVYAAGGELVAASDGGTNDQQIVLPAGTGTWYALVSSHGDYGDVGSYELSVNDLPAGWSTADVGVTGNRGDTGHDAATGTFSVAGSGADVWGTTDAFRFAWRTLTGDGSIVARVTQNQATNSWAKAGVEIRETLAAGSRHVAMVTTSSNGPQLVSRATTGGTSTAVNGTAGPFAATWVRLVRTGNVIVGSRSSDGVAWTTVGSVTVALDTTVLVGLLACAHDVTKINEATFTDVALTGTLDPPEAVSELAAPAAVGVTRGTGTALVVAWQAVADATGYVVERSDDGVDFAEVGTAGPATITWTDAGLAGGRRFFYRVRATDAAGRSAPSAIASEVNRPAAVTDASVTSLTMSDLVLNWRDTSGDTGYRIERSADNLTFTQIATVGANVPSHAVGGLTFGSRYWFRITPLSPFGDAAATVISGSTRLPAVGGLAFTTKSATALAFTWSSMVGATGYRIERSTDGGTFTTLAQVGGDVLAYSDTGVSPVRGYYYRVIATNATAEGTNPLLPIFAATPAAAALPAPWTAADIGNVTGSGATGHDSGTFTVVSSGADIWGTADAFRYTSQTLVGDGSIVARVATVEPTAGWAKVGVMIRESTAANSRHAMVVVSPSNSVAMQYRSSTGGSSTSIAGPAGRAAPHWVRIVRAGNVFTGSTSADGTTWFQVGSVTITMASSVLVGLSADSNITTKLNTSTFDGVVVSNAAPTLAAAATVSPGIVTGTQATLAVLGADDHGEANLSYAWSAIGPATVAFSATGTNTAKTTVATFTKAGSYSLTATITDAGGLSVSAVQSISVVPTLTGIRVSPAAAEIVLGGTLQFAATCIDQFGEPLSPQPACAWIASAGTISAAGLFRAPQIAGAAVITAAVGGVTGTAQVTTVADERIAVSAGQTVLDPGGRSGPITIRKQGPGTLVLTGPNAITGGLVVEEGVVVIRNPAALGSATLEVLSGGLVRVDVGTNAVGMAALVVADGGVVDLASGRLEIATGGCSEADVRRWLVAGRGDGGWSGGTGILSTLAAVSGGTRTVGYRMEETGTTIAFAAAGDLDIDGIVDILDVAALLAGPLAGPPPSPTWSGGDFNYDGVFDALDISDLLAAAVFEAGWYLAVSDPDRT